MILVRMVAVVSERVVVVADSGVFMVTADEVVVEQPRHAAEEL